MLPSRWNNTMLEYDTTVQCITICIDSLDICACLKVINLLCWDFRGLSQTSLVVNSCLEDLLSHYSCWVFFYMLLRCMCLACKCFHWNLMLGGRTTFCCQCYQWVWLSAILSWCLVVAFLKRTQMIVSIIHLRWCFNNRTHKLITWHLAVQHLAVHYCTLSATTQREDNQ